MVGPDDLGEDFDRIGTKRPDDHQKLHDIETPLSGFNRRNHGLRLTEPRRQFDLRDVRPFPSSRQNRADNFVVLGLDPFRGGSHG
jgi:hypothetical protein